MTSRSSALHRLALTCLALWLPLVARGAMVDRIAAVVDDEVIALSEIYELGGSFIDEQCPNGEDVCRRDAELQVLDTLVLRVLIRHELKELDLDVTSEELDRATDQIARDNQLESVDRLRREVENAGMRWDTYREQLKEQIRQLKFNEAVIRPRITITDDELVDLYKRASREFASPSVATVQAITLRVPEGSGEAGMVEAVTQARELRRQVLDGEITWDDAVAQHHSGMFTGPDGMLPPVKKGDLMPALDAVVFSLEPGEIGEPVLAAGTVFVLKLLDRTESGVLPYDQVEDQLRERLYEQKGEAQLEQWFIQAKRKSAVKILLEPPETLK